MPPLNVFETGQAGTTPVSSMGNPAKPEEMVEFVDDVLSTLKAPKRGHEKRWKETILMIGDQQWLDFDEATNNFRAANLSDWTPKPVTNYLVKLYDRGIDIFTSGDLHAATAPATDDQVDIDAAIKAEHILNFLYHQLDTSELHTLAAAWLWSTGNVILFAGYDFRAGEIVQVPRHELKREPLLVQGQPIPDLNGEPLENVTRVQKRDPEGALVFEERKEGQVFERIVTPFTWYPELVELPRDVSYGVEVQAVSLDQLRDLFGKDAVEDVEAEDVSEFSVGNFLESRMLAPIHDSTADEYVLLKTYRAEPGERWEEGKVIIAAGGQLLHESDLEKYYNGKLPYQHMRYREIAGEFWGGGPLDSAVPLQKRLNAIDANIVTHRKTMVNPQVWEPKGAGLPEMTGKSGAKVVWDWKAAGGHKPEVKHSIPLSPEVREERQQTIIDLEAIVGTVEVLSGQQPSGVSTLGQTQILTEQALRRFAPAVRRWKMGLGNHERRKLIIVQSLWRIERLVRVVGENETVETFHFSAADIGNTQDVHIREESGMMFSEVFRQQKVQAAIEMGALDVANPNIANKILDVLEIPGFVNQFTLDAKLARRRLESIKQGVPVGIPGEEAPPGALQARANDNHFIHFEILSDFTKTTEFEALEPQVQQNITVLMAQHQFMVMQQRQQAVQAAQQTRGSGPKAEGAVVDSGAVAPPASSAQQITAA